MKRYHLKLDLKIPAGTVVKLEKSLAESLGDAVKSKGANTLVIKPLTLQAGTNLSADLNITPGWAVNLDDESIRAAHIRSAIAGLDPDKKSHFTNDMKPEVKAIEAMLGWDITAKERNDAWDKINGDA
jgi:hypothetical protein